MTQLHLSEPQKREILSDAFRYLEASRSEKGSNLWGWGGAHMQAHMAAAQRGLDDLISYASGDVHIAMGQHVGTPAQGIAAERNTRLLADMGLEIETLPPEICESSLVHPGTLYTDKGRILSTDLLYRLCIWCQIDKNIGVASTFATFLEIGGGLGQLARLTRLRYPQSKQIMIDLPETLLFAYSFLRANFPDLDHKYCTTRADIDEIASNSTGIFYVPFALAAEMPDIQVDLAINTHSFGEMPPSTGELYFELLQKKLTVSYLYSVNRYLEPFMNHKAPMLAIQPDEKWRTLHWRFNPEHTVNDRPHIPVDLMCTMEVILERVPEKATAPTYPDSAPFVSEAWLRQQWDAVRLNPSAENLTNYTAFLGNLKVREFIVYNDRLKRAGGSCISMLTPDAIRLFDIAPDARRRLSLAWRRMRGR